MITKKQVIDVLKEVDDPELNMDIYSLGLIYDIKILKNKVTIKMTFTTPMCPYGPMLMDLVEEALKKEIKEIKKVKINLVFEPLWQPPENLKAMLGL